MQHVILVKENSETPVIDYMNSAALVAGNPRRETWNAFDSPDGTCTAGIWASQPGAWRFEFPTTKTEFFCVIDGRARVSNQNGEAWEVGPGEAAVIPGGFRGQFHVLEAMRKYFVIVERED
ncbi:DUF861 domain-containing protein [Paraburkholderia sp. LEh10]|uniref:cupin domain-containing protein n=1 Tax=Paraburkholderia sp. LEh10 TaxID=2821353 RepID=UPI001AE82AC8|nr:cupin domain-containing protein [Paraburkholderia sp. LEh10]MBP0596200.1 DUF861 domain-containing protein [Paraburkholderia sp. LEh10]